MTDAVEATGRDSLGRSASPLLAPVRLAIGLFQGLALWWLHSTTDVPLNWPATQPQVFGPLALILAFIPVLLLAGVGRMRWTTLAAWIAVASGLLALMGWHDVARQSAETLREPPFLTFPMPVFAIVVLFIGHHLILPADLSRRRIAPFALYFDTAWKAGVQLALSVGFTGAFWLLLFLGSALFRVIGLTFLEDLTRQTWFYVPVTTVAFSVAVHLTDVRDGLIRGVRTVALMLLSWLLLLMTILAAGFVAALPFTGLQGLWSTGSATSLVLAAVAALIILINTAYQDGRADNLPPAILRLAVRVASVLLTPFVVIAFWGLALRIGQHGLTPDRIIALACAAVGALHAAGYAWAALRTLWLKGDWMRPLEPTNIAGALLALILVLALFSPVLDPARLSVADQVARLERGAVRPDRFDYHFLRFDSGRAGQAALARLTRSGDPAIATPARAAQSVPLTGRFDGVIAIKPMDPARVRIRVQPAGATLPSSFVQQYGRLSTLLSACTTSVVCEARLMDLDRDGDDEVLVARAERIMTFKREADGRWFEWAVYRAASCATRPRPIAGDFAAGRFQTAPPAFPDIIIGGVRLRREEGEPECPSTPEPAPPQPAPAPTPPTPPPAR
jgi:Domain of unknown function (DUF4153)